MAKVLEVPMVDGSVRELIRMAVAEDMGVRGVDETVRAAIPEGLRTTGTIVARRRGTLAGGFLLPEILKEYRSAGELGCEVLVQDGGQLEVNKAIARVRGSARGILSAERTVLNFLGHLSGIATMTARYVEAVKGVRSALGADVLVVDTRKTTPGFRVLDKYAVRCGGGANHRMGLFDGVMLKDNHLAALRERMGEGGQGTIAQVTARIRKEVDAGIRLWLEVDTLEQLAEALPAGGADVILLDNFTAHQMRVAVELRAAARVRVLLEASGGITLENVREVAQTGVDRMAIGALTHSAPALDLSMEFS